MSFKTKYITKQVFGNLYEADKFNTTKQVSRKKKCSKIMAV